MSCLVCCFPSHGNLRLRAPPSPHMESPRNNILRIGEFGANPHLFPSSSQENGPEHFHSQTQCLQSTYFTLLQSVTDLHLVESEGRTNFLETKYANLTDTRLDSNSLGYGAMRGGPRSGAVPPRPGLRHSTPLVPTMISEISKSKFEERRKREGESESETEMDWLDYKANCAISMV